MTLKESVLAAFPISWNDPLLVPFTQKVGGWGYADIEQLIDGIKAKVDAILSRDVAASVSSASEEGGT